MKRKDQPAVEPNEKLNEREDSAERLAPTAEANQPVPPREKFRLIKNENYRPVKSARRARLPIKPKLPPAA